MRGSNQAFISLAIAVVVVVLYALLMAALPCAAAIPHVRSTTCPNKAMMVLNYLAGAVETIRNYTVLG
jgi:hypothetical protein